MYCLFTIQNPSPETAMQVQIYCGASIYAFIRISASVSSVHHADAESVVRSSRRWSYWQMSYLGVSEIMEKTWKTNGNYHMKWNTCSCKIPFVNLLSLMDFPVTCLVYIIQSYGTCLNWFFSSNNSSTKKMTHVECFNSFSRIYEFNLDDKKTTKSLSDPVNINQKIGWTFRTTSWWPSWIQLSLSRDILPPFCTFTKPTGTAAGTAFAVADAKGKPGVCVVPTGRYVSLGFFQKSWQVPIS